MYMTNYSCSMDKQSGESKKAWKTLVDNWHSLPHWYPFAPEIKGEF